MATTSYAQFHVNETARAATAAHERLMRDPFTTLYVYYRPMRIEAFADGEVPTGEGWMLAWPERVPGDRTVEGLTAWFTARTGRVPYLTERLCRHCDKPATVSGDYVAPTCGGSECQEAEYHANAARSKGSRKKAKR